MPSWTSFFSAFGAVGLLSFGGPAAQLALMHRVLVEERKWLDEQTYLNAVSFCMLLPGPEAMQVATYAGWKLRGTLGGLIAGLLFVLPGAAVIATLGALYLAAGALGFVHAAFVGIKAAVLVVVAQALIKVFRKNLPSLQHVLIAFGAFVAVFVFTLPFPLVVFVSAVLGWLFLTGGPKPSAAEPLKLQPLASLRTIVLWLTVWWGPLLALFVLAPQTRLPEIGLFFSKLATVTFGGAYAVLAYMAQDAVGGEGWLSAPEMLDGLALAETTPGPLILVTEYVGMLAAAREGDSLNIWMGLMGAAVALWATFVPCFLWIFAAGPYLNFITAQPRLAAALKGISAAVVGVILNLSLWFALHVLFSQVDRLTFGPAVVWSPAWSSLSLVVLGLVGVASVLLIWLKRSVPLTLAVCAGLALMLWAAGV